MSNSSNSASRSLITAFQRSDSKKVNKMRSVPEALRTAAVQLLERVRVGLDIPSRSEVLDLAERISAISNKLEQLEEKRSADAQLVAELRASAVKPVRKARIAKAKPKASSKGTKKAAGKAKEKTTSKAAPAKAKTAAKKVSAKTQKPAVKSTKKTPSRATKKAPGKSND